MRSSLKQAIEKVEQLPDEEQEAIAAIIELELADEEKWDRRFRESPETLARFVREAKEEYARGETKEFPAN